MTYVQSSNGAVTTSHLVREALKTFKVGSTFTVRDVKDKIEDKTRGRKSVRASIDYLARIGVLEKIAKGLNPDQWEVSHFRIKRVPIEGSETTKPTETLNLVNEINLLLAKLVMKQSPNLTDVSTPDLLTEVAQRLK